MDKPSQHSDNNTNNNQYMKNLNINKLSHKISKPIKKQSFDQNNFDPTPQPPPPPPPSSSQPPPPQNQNQQHQPPVYNINKNDFRDVVQKLTGSPAHERFSTPPPIQPPKPPSSRLQRIRPPPLAQLSNRPPPLLNSALTNSLHFPPLQPPPNTFFHRPAAPLSPLPPLPAHAAAESPVSAYMRYLQNSIPSVDSNKPFAGFAPLVSPRWSNQNQPPPIAPPSPTAGMAAFQLPTSPAPFGCVSSPKSPYGLLVSPSSFPLSPTVPLPSPKWRGL